jgi:hypothetical protein
VEGSSIKADSAVIDAAGNFTETSAQNTSYDYHVKEKLRVTQNTKDLAILWVTGGYSIYKDLRLSKQGQLTLAAASPVRTAEYR